MPTIVTFGNINEFYPFDEIQQNLLTDKLRRPPNGNARILQRNQHRRLAHFLLWESLKTLQIDTALLAEMYTTGSGRPQFPTEYIEFNMTNSGDWVAVILNVQSSCQSRAQSAVGIDMEDPRKSRNFTALMHHFAAQHEISWFMVQPDSAGAFYRCWCLREAVLKSQGVGIVKLSEVMHDPVRLSVRSAYCPPGRLLFTHELPFHFAVFAAGNALNTADYFMWNGTKLQPHQLKSAVHYSVNL